MRFTVVTILPELIEPALAAGVGGRAREAGTIAVATVNPRDFTSDRHRTVDDTPYGGGPGMVMKAEPLLAAIAAAAGAPEPGAPPPRRILLSPAGQPLTQAKVRALARHAHLVLVCGRYEGVDERVIEEAKESSEETTEYGAAVTFEQAEEQAWEEIKTFLRAMPALRFPRADCLSTQGHGLSRVVGCPSREGRGDRYCARH